MEEQIKQFTVEEAGKKQGVIIAMTADEAKDKSYCEYLEAAQREKTADQLRKQPEKPAPTHSREDTSGALREFNEHKRWHAQNPGSKRYY